MSDQYRKCVKCGVTLAKDHTLTFHRFPKIGNGNPETVLRSRIWAEFCFPEENCTDVDFLKKIHTSHKMLCSKHFTEESFINISKTRLNKFSIPIGSEPILEKLRNIPGSSSQVSPTPGPSHEQIQKKQQVEMDQNAFAMKPILIVHGGAGDIPQSRVQGKLDGVKKAVKEGYKLLLQNGSALDAVEAAVVSMEKDEYFNAGYGSVLNLAGEVEMEASIMCGQNLDVGAVTLIKDFLHPISIAHKVLTNSPHSLIGGEGAKLFALEMGFETIPPSSLITENAKATLDEFLKHGEFGRTEIGTAEGGVGTVGAVAIDSNGHIAVATSTGGMSGKAVGRIGDTPQIGSGTYADDNIGGVSTTGHGESILKYCLAHSIIKLMENGLNANTATKNAVTGMTSRLKNTAGAITLSKSGDVGIYFSSARMAWAYIKDDKLFYGIEHNETLESDI